jgi:hypothetical protein
LKTGETGSGRLSKSAKWLWLAFKIGELALAGFQNRRIDSGRLSKALGAAPRNVLSNGSKGFELASFKKLFSNSKAIRAKNWLIQYKIEGTMQKNYEYLPDSLLSKAYQTIPL